LPTETQGISSATPASEEAAETGNDLLWVWIVLGLIVLGLIVAVAARGRRRGKAAAGWTSRAREPYSQAVVLRDRLAGELAAPELTGDRIDQALIDLDGISEKLNALTLDVPDDRSRQALSELLMTLGALRSSLQHLRLVDPEAGQAASANARGRLADLETSLLSFRSTVWPQTRSG
jgi:hypothetical protein